MVTMRPNIVSVTLPVVLEWFEERQLFLMRITLSPYKSSMRYVLKKYLSYCKFRLNRHITLYIHIKSMSNFMSVVKPPIMPNAIQKTAKNTNCVSIILTILYTSFSSFIKFRNRKLSQLKASMVVVFLYGNLMTIHVPYIYIYTYYMTVFELIMTPCNPYHPYICNDVKRFRMPNW